jgi:hypothetical protein
MLPRLIARELIEAEKMVVRILYVEFLDMTVSQAC